MKLKAEEKKGLLFDATDNETKVRFTGASIFALFSKAAPAPLQKPSLCNVGVSWDDPNKSTYPVQKNTCFFFKKNNNLWGLGSSDPSSSIPYTICTRLFSPYFNLRIMRA